MQLIINNYVDITLVVSHADGVYRFAALVVEHASGESTFALLVVIGLSIDTGWCTCMANI